VTGTVATGEEVLVEASLVNYDPTAGRLALTLTAGGTPVAERTVSVGASTERTVSLTHRFGEAGTHELAVNGRSVGTLTVRDPPETATSTPAATPTPPAGTSAPAAPGESDPDGPTGTAATTATARPGTPAAGPGFTALLALLALGLGGLLARRRLR
jgi:PGF-CTERM protein